MSNEGKITISAQDLASEVFARVTEAMRGVGQATSEVASAASSAGASFTSAIQEGFGHAVHEIAGDAEKAGESIKGMFEHPMASLHSFGSAMHEHFLSALGPELGPVLGVASAAIAAVGGAMMELGQHATEVGAAIEKVALIANASAVGISDLKFAFDATGGSIDQLGTAMFMFEKRMGSSADTVEKGLKQVGLSLKDIEGMSSDQQLLAISDAFHHSGDDVNRASAAFEIFGKQGREMLPQLMQDLSGLAAKSKELGNTWTDEDAKAAHEFEIAAKTMATEVGSAWTQLGREIAPVTNEIALGWDRMKLAVANVALTLADVLSAGGWFMALNDWEAGIIEETPKVASALKGLADGSGLAAKGVKDWADQVKEYTGHAPAFDAALENEKESIRDLDSETQKHIDTMLKHQAAVDAVKAALEGDTRSIRDEIEALDQLIAKGITDEDVKTRAIELITKLENKHITLTDRIYAWDHAQRQLLDSVNTSSTALERYDAIVQLVDQTGESFTRLTATMTNEVFGLGEALPTAHFSDLHSVLTGLDDATGHLASTELPAATGALVDFSGSIADANAKGKSFLETLRNGSDDIGLFDSVMGDVPKILERSFTGAGGATGAVKAIGSDVGKKLGSSVQESLFEQMGSSADGGSALTHIFGDTIGGALTTALPGIGAVIGPLAGKLFGMIANIGGPSAAELDGRKLEASFEQSFGGFDKMLAAVGAAYEATGRGAAQAQTDVKALMDAEKNGGAGVQAMIDVINGAFKDQKAKAADVQTGVDGILSAAKAVGGDFPAAMEPMVQKLLSLPGLTDAEKNSLLGLTGAVAPHFDQLTTMAKTYGLGLTDLGPAFEQANISGRADKILTDFGALTKAGADSDHVLHGMGTSINTLVQNAITYGSTLPTALEPLVQQLFKTGQLSDGAGGKLKDLSGLKFDDANDPLASGMDKLTQAINHLGDLLSPAGLPAAAAAAAAAIGVALGGIKAPEIDLHYRYVGDNGLPGGGDGSASYAASGGFVTARGISYFDAGGFVPRGTDTVPAMLTPGEAVLNRGAVASLGRDTIGALNRGGGGDNSALIQALRDDNAALHTTISRYMRDLPNTLTRCLRDARVLAGG